MAKNRDERDNAMHEKLRRAAGDLLMLVGTELRRRGHTVAWHPDRALSRHLPSSTRDWLLEVDGEQVPLKIEEHTVGGYSMMHGRSRSGRLEVACDWVWNMDVGTAKHIQLPRKTFSWSKARAETFGFDVSKVADHLELWLQTHLRTAKLAASRKSFDAQWKAEADRLRAQYPSLASCIESDATGLQLTLQLGTKDAEAVLKVLNRARAT